MRERAGVCQWPMADWPAHDIPDPMPVCGQPTRLGRPYCPEHMQRAVRRSLGPEEDDDDELS